jgi:hypothetical protein
MERVTVDAVARSVFQATFGSKSLLPGRSRSDHPPLAHLEEFAWALAP